MKKAGKTEIREHNKALVLNTLRKGDVSRVELAESTHLANSAITSIVSELISQNFVYEKMVAESSGGRKPVILSLNPSAAYVLVLRIDRSLITIAIVNIALHIEYMDEYKLNCYGKLRVEEAVGAALSRCLEKNENLKDNIVCVGVQIPGVVDHFNNRVVYCTPLGLKNFDIEPSVKKVIDTNVCVIKSSDAELLGESLLRNFDNVSSYLYVVYEAGVGMAFYEEGEIVQYRNGGMQLGHMKLIADGTKKCSCGKYGCVEVYVSEEAAQQSLMELMGVNTIAEAEQRLGAGKLDLDTIIKEANAGEPLCAKVMEGQCLYLGIVLASTVNLFSPHMVIMGGKARLLSDRFKNIIKKTMDEYVLDIYKNIPIQYSKASFEAGCIGIANRSFSQLIFRSEIKTIKMKEMEEMS